MTSKNPAPTVIVYHQVKPGTDCPDGICAAWVAARAIGGSYQLIGDNYLNDSQYDDTYQLPFPVVDRTVILVDFSYPHHIMEYICKLAKDVTVLDHHKSRGEFLLQMSLKNQIKGGFDNNECGATFAWKYFNPDKPMPWFLPYVRQRDIGDDGYYDGLIPNSEAIGEAMSNRRREFGIGEAAFPFFDELCHASEAELIAEGMPKIKKRNEAIEAYLSEWEKFPEILEVAGQSVPFFNCPPHLHRNYSMVGSMGARRWPDYPFVAVVAGDPSKISLRSHSEGADVSEIARALGGGGHRNAAGFSLQ